MKRILVLGSTLYLFIGAGLPAMAQPVSQEDVRINEVQVIGTHNSYHIAPHESMMTIIKEINPGGGASIEYTHPPLSSQFSNLGIRQIELDVRADPDGGLYAKPIGLKMVAEKGLPTDPVHDPEGMLLKPGLKVLHVPDFDFRTTVLTFLEALRQVREWSTKHPEHFPILVMVEVKENRLGPGRTPTVPFDIGQLDRIDEEILSVFKRSQILVPDDVRGEHETLREAVATEGWPSISDSQGKIIFALDNEGAVRDRYLQNHPALRGRMLFTSVKADHPAAAFMKLNDAIKGFDHIQEMVKKGFLVRTRADIGTRESRNNDPTRRDKALASGAQFVSTDYPTANLRFSTYQVRLEGGIVVRTNPVNGDTSLSGLDLEKLPTK